MIRSSELSTLLERCQTVIATILRQATSRSERAGAVADFLRESQPRSVVTACLLSGEGGNYFAIRPEDGAARARLFQTHLSSLDSASAQVRKLPPETLPSAQILAKAIYADEKAHGFLAIGLPSSAAAEEVERTESVLSITASVLALRWSLDALQREESELSRFALVGQAFVGLAHELNNALNSMMLQTSVVQLRVDAQGRQDLAAVRQHGAQAAGFLRTLQHVVQERRQNSSLVDLNSVLHEVLIEAAELRRRVAPSLSEKSPRIQSVRSAVKQLLRLLLEGVCAGTQATVKATTCEQNGDAVLTLSFAAAEGMDSNVESLLWQNVDEVGRLAGQSLLRQQGGLVTVERSNDMMEVRIIWKQTQ